MHGAAICRRGWISTEICMNCTASFLLFPCRLELGDLLCSKALRGQRERASKAQRSWLLRKPLAHSDTPLLEYCRGLWPCTGNLPESQFKVDQCWERFRRDLKSWLVLILQTANPVLSELIQRLTRASFHVGKELYPLVSGFNRCLAWSAMWSVQEGQSSALHLLRVGRTHKGPQHSQDVCGCSVLIDLAQTLFNGLGFRLLQLLPQHKSACTKVCHDEDRVTA